MCLQKVVQACTVLAGSFSKTTNYFRAENQRWMNSGAPWLLTILVRGLSTHLLCSKGAPRLVGNRLPLSLAALPVKNTF